MLNGLVKRRNEEKALFDKPTVNTKCFPATKRVGTGLASTLASIGVDHSYGYRKKIAFVNGIVGYTGKAVENTTMLVLLELGKLVKP